jgi:hypothetical protein
MREKRQWLIGVLHSRVSRLASNDALPPGWYGRVLGVAGAIVHRKLFSSTSLTPDVSSKTTVSRHRILCGVSRSDRSVTMACNRTCNLGLASNACVEESTKC